MGLQCAEAPLCAGVAKPLNALLEFVRLPRVVVQTLIASSGDLVDSLLSLKQASRYIAPNPLPMARIGS